MLEQSHPVLAFLLQYWTIAIFLPAVLLLIAVMVLVTRWRDGRDAVAAQQKGAPSPASSELTEVDNA
jgi:hypothetical protein